MKVGKGMATTGKIDLKKQRKQNKKYSGKSVKTSTFVAPTSGNDLFPA